MPSRFAVRMRVLPLAVVAVCAAVALCLGALPARAYGDEPLPAPPGRVAIKINLMPLPPVTPQVYTRGSNRRHVEPTLTRQPNPIAPPPFLQATAAAGGGGAPEDDSPDMVSASYYGEGEGDSNLEAGSTSFESGTDADGSFFEQASWSDEAIAWTSLAGQCWTHHTSTYIYSFCPFQNITQRSTTTTLHVVLGVFDGWLETASETVVPSVDGATATDPVDPVAPLTTPPSVTMTFTDGTGCAHSKRRSTAVEFVCESESGGISRIGAVAEPATCEYTLRFHTPLMCPGGAMAAVPAASDVPSSLADLATIQSMQECISLLFVHSTDGLRSPYLPSEAQRTCAPFLPVQRESFAGLEGASRTTAERSTPAPSASTTPTGGLDSPALVELAAGTTEEVAPIRANIPSSIVSDTEPRASSSSSNAEPLNADFADAASSPYADIDDLHHA